MSLVSCWLDSPHDAAHGPAPTQVQEGMGEVLAKDTVGRERGWTALSGPGLGCHETFRSWCQPEDIVKTQDSV